MPFFKTIEQARRWRKRRHSDVAIKTWTGSYSYRDATNVATTVQALNANSPCLGQPFARLRTTQIFENVEVPQGAQIVDATLSFTADSAANASGARSNIYCEAADTATPAPRTTLALPVTTAYVTPFNQSNTAVPRTVLVDIYGAPIQEVISRPGWASGNDICLMQEGILGDPAASTWIYDAGPPAGPITLTIRYRER